MKRERESHLLTPSNAEATFRTKHTDVNIFERHLNPVMLEFIRQLSLKTVPAVQSFSTHLHRFILAKLTTTSMRVNLCKISK